MTEPSWSAIEAGAFLQSARQKRGLDLGVLAAQLKVAPARLESLEAGRWQELPDGPYARGLAQAVCRALDVDAVRVLSAMPGGTVNALERVSTGLNQPFREAGVGSNRSLWAGLLLLVLVLAGSSFMWLGSEGGWFASESAQGPLETTNSTAEAADLTASPASAAAVAPAAVVASMPASGAAPQVTPAATVAPVEPALTQAPSTERPAVIATSSQAAPGQGALRIQADQATWVSVSDGRGQSVVSRLLQPAEVLSLDLVAPVRVTLGNAPGARLEWRGQVQDLSAYAGSRVARLELK